MGKKKHIPEKEKKWIEASKKYQLSHAQVQMARQLGMNPKKFRKKANHKQEPWKEPLPDYIETLFYKRFGKHKPENVKSIEQVIKDRKKKKEMKRQEKLKRKQDLDEFD